MHIVKRELRSNLKSLIIWSLSMLALIFLMVSEFSAYYNNPEMAAVLDAMPEALMKAFGFENATLTTPVGFIALAGFYFYLMLSVHSILMGSNIVSKEERDKTAEYMMTLPVSREKILLSKWGASVISALILLLVTILGIIISMLPYDIGKNFYEYIGLLFIALFMIQMIFISLGFLLSSILKRYKHAGKISAGLIMSMYLISIVTGITSKLDFLNYFTPFKYFEPGVLQIERAFDMKYIVISFVITIVAMVVTFVVYPKRDLHL